jgi:hypothetical protein
MKGSTIDEIAAPKYLGVNLDASVADVVRLLNKYNFSEFEKNQLKDIFIRWGRHQYYKGRGFYQNKETER